jgi:hypothetical protein
VDLSTVLGEFGEGSGFTHSRLEDSPAAADADRLDWAWIADRDDVGVAFPGQPQQRAHVARVDLRRFVDDQHAVARDQLAARVIGEQCKSSVHRSESGLDFEPDRCSLRDRDAAGGAAGGLLVAVLDPKRFELLIAHEALGVRGVAFDLLHLLVLPFAQPSGGDVTQLQAAGWVDLEDRSQTRGRVRDVHGVLAVRVVGFGDLLAAVGHEEQGIGRLVDAVDDMLWERPLAQ